MTSTRLRPRCRYISEMPKQMILEKIREQLKENKFPLTGIVVQEHAFIRIIEKNQHYWTPEMHVWVREEEKKTIVYGVIGPKPKIWTMFVFVYTAVLVSTFFAISYGIIQYMLGIKADFLLAIPIGFVGLAMVYGAANWGQYKGREQMLVLQDFLHFTVPKNSGQIN